MKLERKTLLAATALLALAGCASSAPPPSAPLAPAVAVATAELTSSTLAVEGEPEAPHVGKSQRALDDDAQRALDPKRTASREGKRPRVFADWK